MSRLTAALPALAILLLPGAASAQDPIRPPLDVQAPASPVYPSGRAVFDYALAQAADHVEIDVIDARGAVVAGWSSRAKSGPAASGRADRFVLPDALTGPGDQRVTWDLHAGGYFAVGAAGAPPRYVPGPLVPPGRYLLRVAALGQTAQQPFDIVPDLPMAAERQADLDARFDLAMQIRGSASAANSAVARGIAIERRVNARLKTAADPATQEQGAALVRRAGELVGRAGEPVSAEAGVLPLRDGLAALLNDVEGGGRPTDANVQRYRTLTAALESRVVSLNALTDGAFARFERGESAAPDLTGRQFGATTVRFDPKGADFGPWMKAFMTTLNRGWTVPGSVMTHKGHVVVTFVVHRSGAVTDIDVASPSGVMAFDDSARQAVFAASLAQPLPEAYPGETCPFAITFYFNERPPTAPARK